MKARSSNSRRRCVLPIITGNVPLLLGRRRTSNPRSQSKCNKNGTHNANTRSCSRFPVISFHLCNPAFSSVRASREAEHPSTLPAVIRTFRNTTPGHFFSSRLSQRVYRAESYIANAPVENEVRKPRRNRPNSRTLQRRSGGSPRSKAVWGPKWRGVSRWPWQPTQATLCSGGRRQVVCQRLTPP